METIIEKILLVGIKKGKKPNLFQDTLQAVNWRSRGLDLSNFACFSRVL